MRLILMGTGPFAAPTFREIYHTHHDVAALVTSPLVPPRGKDTPPKNILRDIASEHATPIFDPEDINIPESQSLLLKYDADLLVVCDYGQILSSQTLATARFGGINLHASLLPKYRGAAPINWAIYNGESKTGVTMIHMTPKVDAGPCIAQAGIEIGPEETAVDLEKRLSELGAWLAVRTIDAIKAGNLEVLAQDPTRASKAPRLKKADGIIDWSRPAVAIKNQIRALEPWPRTYSYLHRKNAPTMRLILGPVLVEDHSKDSMPGTILEVGKQRLLIATGNGTVAPRGIQPVGKRLMAIGEFIRGHQVQKGDLFSTEP
jgi:methionyl-tRNA formyltransferase